MNRVEERIWPGQRVETIDGHNLGNVMDVHGGHFKVDVRWRPDYWVPTGSVVQVKAETVTLGFTKDELGGYRTERPVIDDSAAGDGILTDVEQDEQRFRMERELDQQRRDLES